MNRARTLLLALGLILCSALMAEFTLRIIRPDSLQYYYDLKRLHAYHPDYLVALAPNEDRIIKHHLGLWEGRFTTNSLGYRGSKELDGRPVLACLGDSLVMGFGVSDEGTFCARLDGTILAGKSNQAMNLGVDAFGSVGFQKRLTEAANKIKLSTVLLFISPNDFTMPPELAQRGVRSDDVIDQERRDHPELLRFFRIQFELTRISYLLHASKLSSEQLILESHIKRASIRNSMIQAGLISPREGDSARPLGFRKYLTSQFYSFPAHKTCEPEQQVNQVISCPEPVPAYIRCQERLPLASELPPLPDITQESYLKMIELSKEKKFNLVPVFLPAQVEEIYCGMYDKSHDLHDYAVRAQAFFKQHGIRYLEMSNHVKDICGLEKKAVRDQVIPGDGHFTDSGNLWIANALKAELKKMEASGAF
ncbi:MAG: lipase [Spirochaetia bacterium]|nr:lipase [Spirochaetia bacterium]